MPLVRPLNLWRNLTRFGAIIPSVRRRVRPTRELLGHLPREDPDLHADRAVGRLGRRGRVVDVGAQRVQRYAPFVVTLGPRDLRTPQPARRLDLDALRAHPHRALDRPLHGPPERDALCQLVRHRIRHELGVELRPLDLLDVDADFLARELRQLVARFVHLGAALADHHARPPRVDLPRHLARLALALHAGNGRVAEPGLQVLADQVVFFQELGEVAPGVVPRAPRLDDPEPEPVGVYFLAHLSARFLLLGLRRLLCLRTLAFRSPGPDGPGHALRFRVRRLGGRGLGRPR